MSEDDLKIEAPEQTLAQWDAIVDCIRQAIKNANHSDAGVRFVRVDGDPGHAFVKAPAGAGAWLTKAWIDAHLWPLIQKRIAGASRAMVDWLGDPANR